MKVVMFYHSLVSDWNHGNAHFLRGFAQELINRGYQVEVYEPQGGWSLSNLLNDYGSEKMDEFRTYFPTLEPHFYDPKNPDYNSLLSGADLVIVHEWNEPELVATIGKLKNLFGYKLLFHDTHHRAVSDEPSMARYDFSEYDGALVFGKVIQDIYQHKQWISRTWVWHEAANHHLFRPQLTQEKKGDLVWIGNWGDNERTKELMEFLIKPVSELNLKAKVYGVRYPQEALDALEEAGIEYGGWLPNYKVPEVFAEYKATVHIPRGPYVKNLSGIPTIRPFEAMSCGIPLICSPWNDSEQLFHPGQDYLTVNNGQEMKDCLKRLLNDEQLSQQLAAHARQTILQRHTCSHRVDELETILEEL
ncbi:CgeB family protein [Legionella jordanis]|uniref:Spore protein YkvP/CgeB glycosyl transferase-like domain-containing protein n=1 Tax=Legionella jordanis TaxID=456 RepID=A0A0W0VGQ2_9GAMM|nr:glycosyltransferase [Legionella jordanis]KTD19053.1 hypothetical protein Ljor_0276 [Legionella jordanis]RMX05393.1 glycosyltransferase [Legionella jordanis]VEH13156.1 Uncharacterized protein conserved in bacteria [Legionella jordanis]HAT8714813.1 glycosyltransferase [Legionella jordanis]